MRTRASTRWAAGIAGVALGGAAACVGARTRLRPWMHRWGATDDEVAMPLPGDELAPDAASIATRAVTVHAPAARVWPWLQQIDQQRGGFYSYRWLENLCGCEMPKVEHLVPEWGEREVSDLVWMMPPRKFNGVARLVVARVDSGRALVLLSPDVYELGRYESSASGSWAFILEPIDEHTTRLLVRSRYERPDLPFEIVHFVMERKMMLTIKRLAEATGNRSDRRMLRIVGG